MVSFLYKERPIKLSSFTLKRRRKTMIEVYQARIDTEKANTGTFYNLASAKWHQIKPWVIHSKQTSVPLEILFKWTTECLATQHHGLNLYTKVDTLIVWCTLLPLNTKILSLVQEVLESKYLSLGKYSEKVYKNFPKNLVHTDKKRRPNVVWPP